MIPASIYGLLGKVEEFVDFLDVQVESDCLTDDDVERVMAFADKDKHFTEHALSENTENAIMVMLCGSRDAGPVVQLLHGIDAIIGVAGLKTGIKAPLAVAKDLLEEGFMFDMFGTISMFAGEDLDDDGYKARAGKIRDLESETGLLLEPVVERDDIIWRDEIRFEYEDLDDGSVILDRLFDLLREHAGVRSIQFFVRLPWDGHWRLA